MKKYNFSTSFFLCIITLAMLCNAGCKKDKKDTTLGRSTALDFTFTGDQWVGETITFTSNNNNNNLVWHFGDSSLTATGPSATHFYTKSDTFNITLVDPSTSDSVIKELIITNGTHRMGGVRLWDGYYSSQSAQTSLTDTTFITGQPKEIIIISDDTIKLASESRIYIYKGSDANSSNYAYNDNLSSGASVGNIIYYHQKDSIILNKFYGSTGGNTRTHIHTQ